MNLTWRDSEDEDGLGREAVSQVSSDGESSDFHWRVTPCTCHVVQGRAVRDGRGRSHWTNRNSAVELLGDEVMCGATAEDVMEFCQKAEDEMVKAFA